MLVLGETYLIKIEGIFIRNIKILGGFLKIVYMYKNEYTSVLLKMGL